MACYSTVGEQPQSRVGRQGLANRQDSNLSFASISTLPWKRESILNLATAGDRQSWKHSLLDPGHKSFRPEADCQLHYECNDPISRYPILIEQSFIVQHTIALRCFALKTLAEDLASQTPEYRWKYFVECNICQKKGGVWRSGGKRGAFCNQYPGPVQKLPRGHILMLFGNIF